MPTFDPKVDAYIARAADFAKPVLEHFRAIVHKASPDITESIKWGVPSFDYKGKMLCSLAAFKQHCALGFWLGAQIKTLQPYLVEVEDRASEFGRIAHIKSVKDLPKNMDLLAAVKEAIALADAGVTLKRAPAKKWRNQRFRKYWPKLWQRIRQRKPSSKNLRLRTVKNIYSG
ncbi:DUF1801 domain-containing protein [Niabella hibiscisoli]|uniref:DUF1801 domain-containing protein n=1 Tax=Niabella hibiscisoli TaxID=1825928 RepID=UPI001F0EE53A|nr:DUF1801 domain-containing protein [Niabella hibiscisoli]MCH5716980.1 DUF1801 domain-containing protein [Niabella hibiscisoli]